jgi:hypothetical protein
MLHIFPSFGQLMNTVPVKIFPFCHKPFVEPFFISLFELKHCVTIPINANQWQSEAKSGKLHGFPAECFQCAVNQLCHMWWNIVMKCHKKIFIKGGQLLLMNSEKHFQEVESFWPHEDNETVKSTFKKLSFWPHEDHETVKSTLKKLSRFDHTKIMKQWKAL